MPRSLCKSETLPKKTLSAWLVPRLRLNECLATVRGIPPGFGRATAFAKGWFVTRDRLPQIQSLPSTASMHRGRTGLGNYPVEQQHAGTITVNEVAGQEPSLSQAIPPPAMEPATHGIPERASISRSHAITLFVVMTRQLETKDPSNAALGRTSATSNSRTDLSRGFTFHCPLCPVQLRGIIANRVA